jgi:hypothetical protein
MMESIKRNVEAILAVSALAGLVWTVAVFADAAPVLTRDLRVVQSQLEQLTDKLLIIEWQNLQDTLKFRALTPQEQVRLCQVSEGLKINAPGCPMIVRPSG